jgi:hypothetical protein
MLNIYATCCLMLSGLAVSVSSSAQTQPAAPNQAAIVQPLVKKPKPISKELSAGLRLNTDGWALFIDKGKVISQDVKRSDMFHDVRLFQYELAEKHHPKELSMYGWDVNKQSNKQYRFAKTNNFYTLKFNYGLRKMLAGKPYPHSVSVHWVYAGGIVLGFLKPYYVDAYVSKDSGINFQQESVKYTAETSPYFLNTTYVIGSSGFAKGIGETKIIPGIHLKTGFHFDYTMDKFKVLAVEVGATAEYYTQKIELMADQKAVPYFFNLYASIQFGKRYQ